MPFIYLVYEIQCSMYAGQTLVHVILTNILNTIIHDLLRCSASISVGMAFDSYFPCIKQRVALLVYSHIHVLSVWGRHWTATGPLFGT